MNGLAGTPVLNGAEYGPIGGLHLNHGTPPRVVNRDAFGKPVLDEVQTGVGLGGSFSNHSSPFIAHAQPAAFPQTPLSQFGGPETRSIPSLTPISDRQNLPFAQHLQAQFAQSPNYAASQSPWHIQEGPVFRRPGPFDANHPTASNTFIAQPIAPSPSFGRVAHGGIPPDQSPWQNTSQVPTNDQWGAAPTASLTAANLGQHDEQQRQAELQQQAAKAAPPETAPGPVPTPVVIEEPQRPAAPPVPTPATPLSTEPVAPPKIRRKSSAQPAQPAPPVPKAAPAPAIPAPALAKPASPAPQLESKVPWAIDEEKKKQSATLNLREIQEAEAKKAEGRKAAERERERAARASQSEDFQPFTASWGLPTSQAGARATNVVKETPATSPFATPAPAPAAPAVWTNAAKAPAAKKTMKEIQEEEERRKKQAAKEKETVAATARRAYAETTTKVSLVDCIRAWLTHPLA